VEIDWLALETDNDSDSEYVDSEYGDSDNE
jgi:hypothetical protein